MFLVSLCVNCYSVSFYVTKKVYECVIICIGVLLFPLSRSNPSMNFECSETPYHISSIARRCHVKMTDKLLQ